MVFRPEVILDIRLVFHSLGKVRVGLEERGVDIFLKISKRL